MTATESSAVWRGTVKDGDGTFKLPKAGFEAPYTYASRFQTGPESNPEELIGAALAGCYSMFLSGVLARNDFSPNKISTTATVHLGDGPTIHKIELECTADVPGLDQSTLEKHAAEAKEGCPVSKALGGVEDLTVKAKLA